MVCVYDPVWAQESKKIASAEQINDACKLIRKWLAENINQHVADTTRVVYGGCVTDTNAKKILAEKDVDGFLVQSTSIKPTFRVLFEIIVEQVCH